jgi:hypothetical protein
MAWYSWGVRSEDVDDPQAQVWQMFQYHSRKVDRADWSAPPPGHVLTASRCQKHERAAVRFVKRQSRGLSPAPQCGAVEALH